MLATPQACYDAVLDQQKRGYMSAGDLFMFASTIMNQEQNSQMFESILSARLGNLSDTIQSD